jgi:hypothetical protein
MIDDPPVCILMAVKKTARACRGGVRRETRQDGFAGLSCIDLYSRYSSSPYTPFSRP